MRYRVIQICLIVGLLCLCSCQGFAQGKKWALLIGIEEYDNPEISKLKFAVKDVNAIARSLQNLGYEPSNIRTMTSAIKDATDPNRPTHENVIETLERLAKSIKPEDTFLFYFTGHGFSKKDDSKEKNTTKKIESFLASVDANPRSISTLRHSAIPLDDLQQAMKNFTAKQILFVIDACRNDPEAGKGDADNKQTDEFSKSLVVASRAAQSGVSGVLFACSNGERAFEDAQKEQSVFTFYLLEALSGKTGSKGPLVMADVEKYVRKQVGDWAGAHNKQQTPELLPKEANALVIADIVNRIVAVQPTREAKPFQGNLSGQTRINPTDGAEMIWIPAGEFWMGDDDKIYDTVSGTRNNPRRRVHLDSFYISKNLVTVKQYRDFVRATGHRTPSPPPWGWHDDYPMVNVIWEDADAYCRWVGGHLPTEAQWEKAARGTDGRKFPWGDTFDGNLLWHSNSQPQDAKHPVPVGSFPQGASPYGVLDMAGNAWEWCNDWYDADYPKHSPSKNPMGPQNGQYRVMRGGSWYNPVGKEYLFRSAWRDSSGYGRPLNGRGNTGDGFRVVLEP